MEEESRRPTVRNVVFEDGRFAVEISDPSGNRTVDVGTPLSLDPSFADRPFEVHKFARMDLSENTIRQVYLGPTVSRGKRIGWIIPANALGSTDHDFAFAKPFLSYAYKIIASELAILADDQIARLEQKAERFESTTFADLYHDNVCFLVISLETLEHGDAFEVARIVPSLLQYGFLPAEMCDPQHIQWTCAPLPAGKLCVVSISSDVTRPEVLARLAILAATADRSIVTQFFYLYQMVEFLMEEVLANHAPNVAKEIIRTIETGQTHALRERIDALQDSMREKVRLDLLMTKYSDAQDQLGDVQARSNDFLSAVGIHNGTTLSTHFYKVRNFVFHQARNLPANSDPLLLAIVIAFFEFVPVLLSTFKLPSQGEHQSL
jgi:hypothetical protein